VVGVAAQEGAERDQDEQYAQRDGPPAAVPRRARLVAGFCGQGVDLSVRDGLRLTPPADPEQAWPTRTMDLGLRSSARRPQSPPARIHTVISAPPLMAALTPPTGPRQR
jgi:hypothetical protein